MIGFAPIAVVGRGCVVAGATSPEMLFDAALSGRSLLSTTPEGRWPGLDPSSLLRSARAGGRVASLAGGYVREQPPLGKEIAARIPEFERLDPLVHWLAHCAAAAIDRVNATVRSRFGLIVGNLSYPSRSGAAYVEGFWSGANSQDPRNRFSSGLPVHLVAEGLGFGGPAFAIDGACASSLYAIKLACNALHDGEADLVVAGGVNGADDLFLHLGFTALQALSPSGRSRPFHAGADGLVPSEGCALVALKRLDDAVRAGDRVFGVIRGVGVGNDGRQNGFLAPDASGQSRAMALALDQSGFDPGDISFVECHATGTARGDATELESLARVYGDAPLVLGALKGVLGHAITASGAASLISVLASFEADAIAPTLCDSLAPGLRDLPFSLPQERALWSSARKRAAISNFGFGGNNAHLIVEEFSPEPRRLKAGGPAARRDEIVICGVGVLVGETRGLNQFRARLLGPKSPPCSADRIVLDMQKLGFPPSDLKASLAQQTAMMEVVEEALSDVSALPTERTGVFVGMGCDTTIARHGIRLRCEGDEAWLNANALSAPQLTAQGVLGTMPNIPANRIQTHRDIRGFGFTVSSEEHSGLVALDIAKRALRAGELDAAIVGAVDFSCEPAHAEAHRKLLHGAAPPPGDAAVAIVVKRRTDAEAAGDPIWATLDERDDGPPAVEMRSAMVERFGHAHAARALLDMVGDAVVARARVRVDNAGAQPSGRAPSIRRIHRSVSGRTQSSGVSVPGQTTDPTALSIIPQIALFSGASRSDLLSRMGRNQRGGAGPYRCGLVSDSDNGLAELSHRVTQALERGALPLMPGVAFADAPFDGEIAFTFTGAAAAYPGAGRELLLAWPELGASLIERHRGADALMAAVYGADVGVLDPRIQLTGCALVCQAHAAFTQQILKLKPSAAIGLSSGETNALLAFRVWRDLDAMLDEIDRSGLYGDALTGRVRAAAETWGLAGDDAAGWACWRIAAPREAVEAALERETRAYMTIVHAPDDCVIGGDPEACSRVVEAVGRKVAFPLGLDMVVHCEALTPFAARWRKIHTRAVFDAPDVRFYSNAYNTHYTPTSDAAAQAITLQALNPIDFPRTVRAAWNDGVRIFIEHGPRAILTGAVSKILHDRPHLAVALDSQERRGLRALCESITKLWVHGVDVDVQSLEGRLDALRQTQGARMKAPDRTLVLPAHPPPIVKVARQDVVDEQPMSKDQWSPGQGQVMAPAPSGLSPLVTLGGGHHGEGGRTRAPDGEGPQSIAMKFIQGVGQAHHAFLTRQAEAHEAFLQSQLIWAALARTRPEPAQIRPREARPLLNPPSGAAQKEADPRPASQTGPTASSSHRVSRALFSRRDLESLASGRISDVFGPLFAQQDGFARQVRMPQPPLLLADRVMALEGEPGSMGRGRIVTETDVAADAWYMHNGRMCPGVVIESGQADLLLASWLGADFVNRGERVYRLLGCDLTFMGELPKAGETLRYDIHIDGHAKNGGTRLFFFHYDCFIGDRLMISVRNGQAGFFTDEELAQSGGVLWDADGDNVLQNARRDTPPQVTRLKAFGRDALDAFAGGDAFACFGEGFEMAAAHVRTPTIAGGRLRLIDEVTAFEPEGGPWGRGYLKARAVVAADAWFYDGHFKNDPCMPGTLMADAATQALSFAMAAYGFTIARDGWRFEPVAGEMARFVCRGQVTPDRAHILDYEVFVEEIIDGPEPTIFAALLCRSDGFKVFHCRRFGMRLVPDWPGALGPDVSSNQKTQRFVGEAGDVRGDIGGLMACAQGRPSNAFGELYRVFDGPRRAPRLPGPPYHFVSRIVSVDGRAGVPAAGHCVVAEYDAPDAAWYFSDGGGETVPLSVLVEILLQPCGWLASYMGFAANRSQDVAFRNLDGSEVLLHRPARAGTIRTTARLERFADAAGSTIVFFAVTASQNGELVMTMKTAFGFFSPTALRTQTGLPALAGSNHELVPPEAEAAGRPVRDDRSSWRLWRANGKLRLLDEIAGFLPSGGAAGLGRTIARAEVDPRAWFFRAHFFQDPVQPGSLGLEALQQTLRASLILGGYCGHAGAASFHPVAAGTPFSWKFRGQILPTNKVVATQFDILSLRVDEGLVTAHGDGSVWVDGVRIYEVKGMGAVAVCA